MITITPAQSFFRIGFCALLAFLASCIPAHAQTPAEVSIYVDNVAGSDSGDGSKASPFMTFAKALEGSVPGVTIHLVPNKQPYRDAMKIQKGGSVEQPLIIDGHGSWICRLAQPPLEEWTDEGDNVFSHTLRNNAWVMDDDGYWKGSFDIVFLDEKPAQNCSSRKSLQPGSALLLKIPPAKNTEVSAEKPSRDPLHNRLYVKLPEGKTPADIKIEVPSRVGVGVQADNVIVRNLSVSYTSTDGFSSTKSTGLVFENVRGWRNMDQGISNHGSQAIVRNSIFDENAGCGIVDVHKGGDITYENCIIENNCYRGGVELLAPKQKMIRCIIRNNDTKGITINRKGNVEITDCLIEGRNSEDDGAAISVAQGCTVKISNSTISNYPNSIKVFAVKGKTTLQEKTTLELSGLLFRNTKTALWINTSDPQNLQLNVSDCMLPECEVSFDGKPHPASELPNLSMAPRWNFTNNLILATPKFPEGLSTNIEGRHFGVTGKLPSRPAEPDRSDL